jgi:imidazolonepropionase-like amidohydrolase
VQKKVAIFFFILNVLFSYSGYASDQILLKNANVYTMGASGILAKGMILIKEGKIEKVGTDIAVPSDTKVLDLPGKTIIPGLVCASSALFIEKKDLQHSGEESHDSDVLEGIHYFDPHVNQILEHGVTTVYISPVSFRSTGGLGAVVKVHSGEDGKIAVIKSKAALNLRLDRLQDKKTSNVFRLSQYHRIRDQFRQAEEYRKEWTDYQRKLEKYEIEQKKLNEDKTEEPEKKPAKKAPAAKKPNEPKRDESKEILLQAMDKKIPVRFIVHRQDSILQALRLSEEFGLRIILEQAEEWPQLLDELEKTSPPLLSSPLLDHRRFLIPGGERGFAAGYLKIKEAELYYPPRAGTSDTKEALDSWKELANSKVPFALVPPDPFPLSARFLRFYASLLESMRVSPEIALRAVTSYAAEILGVSDRVGSLEEGKDADLVVLDGEPLNSLSRIDMVFSEGMTVWEKKR